MSTTGIIYTTTGEHQRGSVAGYHSKPAPLFLNKSKHSVDVSGLKKSDQRKAIKFDGMDFESKFTIGFEVEKNELSRNAVREYELFCGFERDGSCGYEAVTHVLPLLPAGKWRTKVFDMMHKAEKIIDDRYSPSDKRCGGHITIAIDGMTANEMRLSLRKNAGIVLALFRHRLNTKYCGSNRRLQTGGDTGINSWSGCSDYRSYHIHPKYQTALMKEARWNQSACFEFRVPSKFESVKQMMRRYELFYELVDFSINTPNGSHDAFLKRIKPIIISMYNGDEQKANKVIDLSKHFRRFILTGVISADINSYLT